VRAPSRAFGKTARGPPAEATSATPSPVTSATAASADVVARRVQVVLVREAAGAVTEQHVQPRALGGVDDVGVTVLVDVAELDVVDAEGVVDRSDGGRAERPAAVARQHQHLRRGAGEALGADDGVQVTVLVQVTEDGRASRPARQRVRDRRAEAAAVAGQGEQLPAGRVLTDHDEVAVAVLVHVGDGGSRRHGTLGERHRLARSELAGTGAHVQVDPPVDDDRVGPAVPVQVTHREPGERPVPPAADAERVGERAGRVVQVSVDAGTAAGPAPIVGVHEVEVVVAVEVDEGGVGQVAAGDARGGSTPRQPHDRHAVVGRAGDAAVRRRPHDELGHAVAVQVAGDDDVPLRRRHVDAVRPQVAARQHEPRSRAGPDPCLAHVAPPRRPQDSEPYRPFGNTGWRGPCGVDGRVPPSGTDRRPRSDGRLGCGWDTIGR
jgi:hypothetical protein